MLPTSGTVTAIELADIGANVGFIGKVFRCHLTWSDSDTATSTDQPASVIVKVPTDNDENFALGDGLQLYEREITVYQELRASLGFPMPEYLYGAFDPDPAPWIERPLLFLFDRLPVRGINWLIAQFLKLSGKSKRRYVLVLEDIADARPPTQAAGGSLDDALAALKVLASFHAHNWMRSEIVENHKRVWAFDRGCRVYQASYVRNLDAFRAHYRERLGADVLARLDEIQERATQLNRDLAAAPWTLLHGDYRLDNILFGTGPEAPPITTVDWQTVSWGRPLTDVAYFISGALSRPEQAEHHTALLDRYNTQLATYGIELDSDQLRRGYALGSGSGYVMAVIASQIVERTERGDAMFVAMARGSAALADDVGLPDLLD